MSRIFSHVMFSIFLIIAAPALSRAGDPGWRLVETSGPVEMSNASGGFIPAALSNEIAPGTELRTGSGGRAVIENNGDRITLSPNSVFKLPPQQAGMMTHVQETIGTLLYDMVPRGVDRFRVDTPYLAAVIKGTVFTVSVTPQGSAVEVLRGVVQVTNGFGQSPTLVYPGQTAAVLASAKGDVHLMGKPPASLPQSAKPAAVQPDAPNLAPEAAPAGAVHSDAIEHTVEPQAVAIGKLTNGLVTDIDATPGRGDARSATADGKADGGQKASAAGLVVNDGDTSGGASLAGRDGAGIGSSVGLVGSGGISNALGNVQRGAQGNAGNALAANGNGGAGTMLAADHGFGNSAGSNGNGNNGNAGGNNGNNHGNGNNGSGNNGSGNNGNGNNGNGKN